MEEVQRWIQVIEPGTLVDTLVAGGGHACEDLVRQGHVLRGVGPLCRAQRVKQHDGLTRRDARKWAEGLLSKRSCAIWYAPPCNGGSP